MARYGRFLTQSDLDDINLYSYVDVTVGDENCFHVLRAPLFSDTEPDYIVEVRLHLGRRLIVEWTLDRSTMITEFDSAVSSSLTDGKYVLASALYMALFIEKGKPFRDDFLHHDQSNRARCCNEARAFLLIDPTTSRTSTYVQLNTNLIIELSHNHRGCVHLWRRQVD